MKMLEMQKRKVWFLVAGAAIVSMLLAACGGEVVTVVVTGEGGGQVVVTATPAPPAPVTFESEEPEVFTYAAGGDVSTLDPAWNYESVGAGFIEDVYDQLVEYEGADPTKFVGELATDWEVSEDGMTYVFHIRDGVTFHEGQTLMAEDVAYSFQRAILQGGSWSPQWLYTEALFGTGVYDIAELIDPAVANDPEALRAEDPAELLATCERVTEAISFDEETRTVTFQFFQPWGPMIATMTGSWGSVLSKEWAVANGAWDGDCATWQNFYGVTSETTPLRDIMNGTGPYIFDHWTPGEEFVLVSNPNYWLAEPMYEGGPIGEPALKRIVWQIVNEWGTRFAMMQAGDIDFTGVPRENVAQVDPLVGERCDYVDVGEWDCYTTESPDAPLRLWFGMPSTGRTDAFFTFDINDDGGNPLMGSGELDGNGIPADFFSDEHVRKGFNYCFDHDAYIEQVLAGEGVQNYGPINAGTIGYDYNAPHYYFDLELCEEELALAWDGVLPETGFRLQIAFNTGNDTRQSVSQIIQEGVSAIGPNYVVEVLSLPWPSFLSAIQATRIPIFVNGWGEDIHDPHNWAQPFLVGAFGTQQNMPDWMMAEFSELVSAGVSGTTDEARAAVYSEIQIKDYEYALGIRMAVATGRRYEQRWVQGYFYNPMMRLPFYYWSKQ